MAENAPTLQQVADMAARGMLEQMQRCHGESPSGYLNCLYSDSAGNHCAIGWALTPELQAQVGGFLGDVYELLVAFPSVRAYFADCQFTDLKRLQEIHDIKLPENWRDALRTFYSQRGLTFPQDV